MTTPDAARARAGSNRTARRPAGLRTASPIMRIAMVLFAIGVIAIVAAIVLFASGARDLPLWLNLTALLAPVGFGLGLLAAFLENRRARRPHPGTDD